MLDREAAEALFLEHLDWIDRAATRACSRKGVWGDEAEDFVAQVRMKLMEDDYAVVRRYVGNSEFRTYVATVVQRHFADFLRELRGRWRTSAAAERLGPPAPELETLVRHSGYTLREAGEKLRTGGRTTLSDAELARILVQLPERQPLRPVVAEPAAGLDAAPGASRADERVLESEADTRRAEIMATLKAALQQLEQEDQLIVRMHFTEGRTLAEVARTLRLEQKPLYRRVDRLRTRLRALLEDAGLSADGVLDLLHGRDAP